MNHDTIVLSPEQAAAVATLSDRCADIVIGGTKPATAAPTWTELQALANAVLPADMSVARSELLARVEWASAALDAYPATPQLPVMELTLPMPVWADL